MISYIRQWKTNFDTQILFKRQVNTFIILFLGYASLHCMRTGWSFTQKYIQDDLPEITNYQIGLMDTAFLLFLGIGLYFCGHICKQQFIILSDQNLRIGDSFNPKSFLLFGMIFSAASLLSIGILRVFFITNVFLYIFLQALNGLFESAALPGYMRLMGNWYSSENRGLIMGIWSGCRSFGDTAGLFIGDLVILQMNFNWYWGLVTFGGIALFMSYVIYEFISEKPYQETLAVIQEDEHEECSILNPSIFHKSQLDGNKNKNMFQMTDMSNDDLENLREKLILKYGGSSGVMNSKKGTEKYPSISIIQALKIPGVIWYTTDFMCLKSLNYGILFWFPKFLQESSLESNSSSISAMWSFGMLLGGIFSGYLGDKLHNKRGILMPPSLILLIISLGWFNNLDSTNSNLATFYLVSFLIGIFLGGPFNVQHGPLLIDLGKHSHLKGNQQAIGTITGIVEGAGSLASAVIQMLIPIFGQENMFITFIILAILGILFILPIAIDDYKYLKKQESWYNQKKESNTLSISITKVSQEMKNYQSKIIID